MTTAQLINQFENVLEAEQLADVDSAFRDPDFCDEVPLYSRYDQIRFLVSLREVDCSLVELALDYLDRVVAHVPISTDGWVAISIYRDDTDPIVPAIFLCKHDAPRKLGNLRLVTRMTEFGRQIRELVKKTRANWTDYSLYEESATLDGEIRVFISKRPPPFAVLFT